MFLAIDSKILLIFWRLLKNTSVPVDDKKEGFDSTKKLEFAFVVIII